MKYQLLTCVLILSLTSGCATVTTSRHVDAKVSLPSDHAALRYFLPKGVIRVAVMKKDLGVPVGGAANAPHTLSYRLDVSDVSYVPDYSQGYELHYHPSIWAEDAVTVTANSKGLLSKVQVTTEDKTGAIFLKLAELGKEAVKAAFVSFETKPGEEVVYEEILDPLDAAAVVALDTKVKSIDASLSFDAAPEGGVPGAGPATAPTTNVTGVVYRPLIACKIKTRSGGTPNAIVYVPNIYTLDSFSISRGAFIKKVSTLGFDNGVLTEIVLNKPSEAYGFMTLPVDLVKLIASIPGELLTIRVTNAKGDTDVLKAQTALIEAEAALQKAQKK